MPILAFISHSKEERDQALNDFLKLADKAKVLVLNVQHYERDTVINSKRLNGDLTELQAGRAIARPSPHSATCEIPTMPKALVILEGETLPISTIPMINKLVKLDHCTFSIEKERTLLRSEFAEYAIAAAAHQLLITVTSPHSYASSQSSSPHRSPENEGQICRDALEASNKFNKTPTPEPPAVIKSPKM